MNELKIFNNEEFGSIRTVTDKVNNVWFVGKDVAEALGYKDTPNAIRDHVDSEDKHQVKVGEIPTLKTSNYGAVLINESGLYSLVLSSKLPGARKFKRWVTSEVLPSIRKNGGYIAGQETLTDEELLAKALMVAQNKIAEKDALIHRQQLQIEEAKPKTIFADAVATSKTSILIGELAKLICQNGVQIGQKRLFQWMRDNGYLMKSGTQWNIPQQRYVEHGLFEIKESTIQNPDGSVRITVTTKVTGKGQVYFVNKFLNQGS